MYQLSIDYFWPLTEQIDLDLDYTPCTDYIEEQRARLALESSGNLLVGSSNWITSAALTNPTITFTSNGSERMRFDESGIKMLPAGTTKAGYWAVNGNDFRIYRDKKPSWIARKATEAIFGWKWNDEC